MKNRLINLLAIFSLIFLCSCASHTNYSKNQLEDKLIKKTKLKDEIESEFIKIDSMDFHYLKTGKGPTLILIHGWVCSSYFWTPVMEDLHESFTIYSVDMMGHGLSQKKFEKSILLTPENQSSWILKFMDEVGIESANVVGHSMGGETAARLASKAPERVDKLVLIDAIGIKENPKLIPWYAKVAKNTFLVNLAPSFFTKGSVSFFTNRLMKGEKTKVPDWFVEEVVLQNTNNKDDSKALLKATKEGLFKEFIEEKAANIKAPVLCIWGTDDKVVPMELGKKYISLINGSKLEIVDGAGHLLPIERSKLISSKIYKFINAE